MLQVTLFSACYYDVEEELYPASGNCDTSVVTYSGFVEPTLSNFCIGCHSISAGPSNGNVILEGHSNASKHALDGSLVGAISHASGYSPMPQGGDKLSDCTIDKIAKWANEGAPNN